MYFRKTALATACALTSPVLWAAAAQGPNSAHALDELVVVASRVEETAGDTAATVTSIDAEEIDRRNVRDIKDLVRYEPGVSVSNDAARFGLGGFVIRGLGGNRVAVEVDGVPISDAFSIGSFSNAGRDTIDVDLLKQVEIVRGPSSSLYGSDALAGVVGFVTKDPDDLVSPEAPVYRRFKLGAHGLDDSTLGNALLATQAGRWSMLAQLSRRSGHERDNQGELDTLNRTRTSPNPQDYEDRSFLAKLAFDAASGHRLKLTVDGLDATTQTQVYSARGSQVMGPSTVRVDELTGDDTQQRERLSLEYVAQGSGPWFDEAHLLVYRQDTQTTQDTDERRTTIAASGTSTPVLRERRFRFDQRSEGFEAVLHRTASLGAAEHRFVYGLDWQETDTTQLRDGLQRNLATGAVTPVVLPDTFPVRDFPLSRTREQAVFVEDRIRWLDGRFELTPGLRWDRVALEPELDAIFAADNPGVTPQSATFQEASPRLGAAWRFADAWALHAQWSEGFRAPPYNDVNVGFTNLQFGYTALPNRDLEPESSRGGEVSLRWRGPDAYAALTVFRTDYRDFIESFVNVGRNEQGLMVFQSRNIADVQIEGAELRAAATLDAWCGVCTGWRLNAALSHARGDDRSRGVPLNSIDPDRAVVGLGYAEPHGRWDIEAVVSTATRKRRIDTSAGAQFAPPGHAVFDLIAQWRPAAEVTLNLGVFNLADRTSWDWADVRGRPANDPAIERFTAPGRNLSANLILEF